MKFRRYNFVSPKPIYARVKEEMKRYFASGAVDDLLFPIWTQDCLKKFKKTYLKKVETMLELQHGEAELPCDFISAREVWFCSDKFVSAKLETPTAYYYQKDCRITPVRGGCEDGCPEEVEEIPEDECYTIPEKYRVTHKVTGELLFTFQVSGLLKPGNMTTIKSCASDCLNIYSTDIDTFDIIGKKLITSFSSGKIYLVYYADPMNEEEGYSDIPDEFRMQDYIYKYIRYMIYKQLYDQTNDETFNQIRTKKEEAKMEADEALAMALIEAKSETVEDKVNAIKKSYNRHNKFRFRS